MKEEIERLKKTIRDLNEVNVRNQEIINAYERGLHMFTQPHKIEENLDTLLDIAVSVSHTNSGSILLLDEGENNLYFATASGPKAFEVKKFRVPVNEGLAGHCFSNKETIVVSEAPADKRFYKKISEAVGYQVTSLAAVPIIWKGESLGVLEVLNKEDGKSFSHIDIGLLERLARVAATLIVVGSHIRS